MKDKPRWGLPGWPWELELLALVFVVTAIAVPYYLHYMQAPDPSQLSLLAKAEMAKKQQMATWQDLEGFFWAVVIVGLYLAHLAMASASIDYMSTPFTHLFSPLVFSSISYYRLFEITRGSTLNTNIVSGSFLEVLLWLFGVLVITFLLARIRMARLMLGFRNVDWDVSSPTLVDKSYIGLLLHIRPLIYFPRVCRACDQGILIEGWFYAMPIPFDSIQSMDPIHESTFVLSGYCLATSTNAMLRIQVTEKSEPILISPKHSDTFARYCKQFIGRKRTGATWPGATKPGANAIETKPA